MPKLILEKDKPLRVEVQNNYSAGHVVYYHIFHTLFYTEKKEIECPIIIEKVEGVNDSYNPEQLVGSYPEIYEISIDKNLYKTKKHSNTVWKIYWKIYFDSSRSFEKSDKILFENSKLEVIIK